jgi:hypothetical protein
VDSIFVCRAGPFKFNASFILLLPAVQDFLQDEFHRFGMPSWRWPKSLDIV